MPTCKNKYGVQGWIGYCLMFVWGQALSALRSYSLHVFGYSWLCSETMRCQDGIQASYIQNMCFSSLSYLPILGIFFLIKVGQGLLKSNWKVLKISRFIENRGAWWWAVRSVWLLDNSGGNCNVRKDEYISPNESKAFYSDKMIQQHSNIIHDVVIVPA